MIYYNNIRLDDFENACAAYEKSLGLTDDYITHLNYAITLFSNDEIEKSKSRLEKYEKSLANHLHTTERNNGPQVDPDIMHQAEILRQALKKSSVEF